MNEDLAAELRNAELRKLLEELLLPELRAIAHKLDELRERMVLSEQQMNARMEAIWREVARSKVSQAEVPVAKESIN